MTIVNNFAILAGLSQLAGGRDFITTAEFARVTNKQTQTIRKEHSAHGEAYGIRPIKIGNRLLWPVQKVALLLEGEL
jgi:hypothetical protein